MFLAGRREEISTSKAVGIEKVQGWPSFPLHTIKEIMRRQPSTRNLKKKLCFNCGGDYLHRFSCPAKHKPCQSCGKIGHFAKSVPFSSDTKVSYQDPSSWITTDRPFRHWGCRTVLLFCQNATCGATTWWYHYFAKEGWNDCWYRLYLQYYSIITIAKMEHRSLKEDLSTYLLSYRNILTQPQVHRCSKREISLRRKIISK